MRGSERKNRWVLRRFVHQAVCYLTLRSITSEWHLFEGMKDIWLHEEVRRGSWKQGGARE